MVQRAFPRKTRNKNAKKYIQSLVKVFITEKTNNQLVDSEQVRITVFIAKSRNPVEFLEEQLQEHSSSKDKKLSDSWQYHLYRRMP
jgi:hypothetical protein